MATWLAILFLINARSETLGPVPAAREKMWNAAQDDNAGTGEIGNSTYYLFPAGKAAPLVVVGSSAMYEDPPKHQATIYTMKSGRPTRLYREPWRLAVPHSYAKGSVPDGTMARYLRWSLGSLPERNRTPPLVNEILEDRRRWVRYRLNFGLVHCDLVDLTGVSQTGFTTGDEVENADGSFTALSMLFAPCGGAAVPGKGACRLQDPPRTWPAHYPRQFADRSRPAMTEAALESCSDG